MPDCNAWMLEQIDAAVPKSGKWVSRDIAAQLVARLDREQPDVFATWMRAHAVDLICQHLIQRRRSFNARVRAQAKPRAFSEEAARYEGGDGAALDPYLMQFAVDEAKGEFMSLGDMRGTDCLVAAEPFRRRENENAMQAAFLEAIADKAGRRKVKNVLERDQLVGMMASIGMEV